jgi:hypothetical protein
VFLTPYPKTDGRGRKVAIDSELKERRKDKSIIDKPEVSELSYLKIIDTLVSIKHIKEHVN